MPRDLRFRPTFEGKGGGLDHDRLAVDAFAPAFLELQRAFRRIAQGFVKAATEESRDFVEAPYGPFSKMVAEFSLKIDTISHNSPPYVDLVCPVPQAVVGSTWPMFLEDTIDRTADELLSAIESEAKGVIRNSSVRSYLASIPAGVVRQTFEVEKIDGTHREITFGAYERAELDRDYPSFVFQTGHIGGVTFDPLPLEVRFFTDGAISHAFADSSQVEQALQHRSQQMSGLFIRKGKRATALWLEPGDHVPESPSRAARASHLASRWAGALRLLAE